MDFLFNSEQIMLREMVKDFADKEIRPIAKKIDDDQEIPKELFSKLAQAGLFGTAFPEEYGGGGFGEFGFCIQQEEISKVCGSTAATIGAHQSIGANAIYLGGSEELKKKYLPILTSGESIAAFCLTEAEAGSDAFNLKSTAKLIGDKWILNGTKVWVTNGAYADVYSVFARTENGISAFVVEKKFDGVQVGPNEKKLGLKGSATNVITFNDVAIPKENLIGIDGRGFLIAMATLNSGRIGLAACCLGAAKELLEASVSYAKQRKQFNEPLIKFQAVQFMIAEITTKIYSMESMIYRTAKRYDDKKDIVQEASMIKLYCSEAVSEIADKALQIHGGMGFSADLSIERFYRDARVLRIFEGTSEIQKLIISRHAIKKNGKWKF